MQLLHAIALDNNVNVATSHTTHGTGTDGEGSSWELAKIASYLGSSFFGSIPTWLSLCNGIQGNAQRSGIGGNTSQSHHRSSTYRHSCRLKPSYILHNEAFHLANHRIRRLKPCSLGHFQADGNRIGSLLWHIDKSNHRNQCNTCYQQYQNHCQKQNLVMEHPANTVCITIVYTIKKSTDSTVKFSSHTSQLTLCDIF